MKKSIQFLLLFAMCGIFVQFVNGAAFGPYELSIKQILERRYDLVQENVRVTGKVLRFSDSKDASSRAYILQDGWSDEIKIVTKNQTPPEMGRRYVVTGIVFMDNSDSNNPEAYILEISREGEIADQQGGTSVGNGQGNNKLRNILYGIAAVFLVVIAFLIILLQSRKKEGFTASTVPIAGFNDSGLQPGFPEPASYVEDAAVKFAAPPAGTLKLLTGRLEIISGGDQFKDIRFYKHPTQEETEFTFGRDTGTPYLHFQLKSPTVSTKQAKIMWTNKQYMLINYSTTNPTKLNDVALEKDQSKFLEDNVTIEMGEVVFKFHEK